MRNTRINLSVMLAVVITAVSAGLTTSSAAEIPTIKTTEVNRSFVEQDEQKEQDLIHEAVSRIEAEKRAIQVEKEKQEALRIAQEAEKARVEAERKAQEAENARLAAEAQEAEQARILAEQEAEKVRLAEEEQARIVEAENARLAEEERLRQEALVPPAPTPALSGQAWIDATMAQYGVYPPAGTTFRITDEGNCGGPGGACTAGTMNNETGEFFGPFVVTLSPGAIGTAHILFHEIAHTRGIVDECGAEAFAQSITGDYNTYASTYTFCR